MGFPCEEFGIARASADEMDGGAHWGSLGGREALTSEDTDNGHESPQDLARMLRFARELRVASGALTDRNGVAVMSPLKL